MSVFTTVEDLMIIDAFEDCELGDFNPPLFEGAPQDTYLLAWDIMNEFLERIFQ